MMQRMLYVTVMLVLFSCAKGRVENNVLEMPIIEKQQAQMEKIMLIPGSVGIIRFPLGPQMNDAQLLCNGERFMFFVDGNMGIAFIAESYFSKLTSYVCEFKNGSESIVVAEVQILPTTFPVEVLRVKKKYIALTGKDIALVEKEQKSLRTVYTDTGPAPRFSTSFQFPMNTVITAKYGTKRIFNKSKNTQHLGLDFRAPLGEKIHVSNDGKVVFSGKLFFSGNTVIVDHGLEIFSMYAHLSKRKVQKGDLLKKGDCIGLTGMTGRANGPHLHWGVKIHGLWIDGLSLVEKSREYYKK